MNILKRGGGRSRRREGDGAGTMKHEAASSSQIYAPSLEGIPPELLAALPREKDDRERVERI